MGLLDVFRRTVALAETADAEPAVPLSEVAALANQNELLQESLLGLEELALEDLGWRRMVAEAPYQFSRRGLLLITAMCRVMAIKNPLIKRGLGVRAAYVWGQGVQVTARADGDAPQNVAALINTWWNHSDTQRVLSGAQAQAERERDLGTDGQLFLSAVTDRRTGHVTLRVVPQGQIIEHISNPDDLTDVWYYQREWSVNTVDLTNGGLNQGLRTVWYPALGYTPAPNARPQTIAGQPVLWDEPILHCAVNRPTESIWGIPDAYAAVDWARAYSEFLTDWAKLMRALAKYAWRAQAPGAKAANLRAKLNANPAGVTDPLTGRPLPPAAGSAAVMTPDITLEAIPKTGATLDADSGKPLAAMVSAALDVPVTILLGDPGITGAQAVATTLDRPFELAMTNRRNLWATWIRELCGHVIDAAVLAPAGPLRGVATQAGTRRTVILAGDTERTVEVTWPKLDEQSPQTMIQAIVQADSTGKLPPTTVVRLLLQALGVTDIDELIDEMTDDEGQFIDPAVTAGSVAVARFRDGQDPAAVTR